MTPLQLADKHMTLAENQEEFQSLDIIVMMDDADNLMMCSRWQPTAEELEALNAGAPVQLAILTDPKAMAKGVATHPPVIVGVYSPPVNDPKSP